MQTLALRPQVSRIPPPSKLVKKVHHTRPVWAQAWYKPAIILLLLLAVWFTAPYWLYRADPLAALPDNGIWLLLVPALAAFLLITALSGWLVQQLWERLELPPGNQLRKQFKTLTPWQQILLYWASFACLLLAGVCSLAVIC